MTCIRMSTRLRSFTVVAALLASACGPSVPGLASAPEPARQPSVTTDVVYGHKDGLALTFDVHWPARPNGAGIISIISGGWQSSVEMAGFIAAYYPPLNEKGFTVFAVRHGSSPRYPMSAIVADVRRVSLGKQAGFPGDQVDGGRSGGSTHRFASRPREWRRGSSYTATPTGSYRSSRERRCTKRCRRRGVGIVHPNRRRWTPV